MEFTFNAKPLAKQRPRFGKRGKVYDPQKAQSLGFKFEARRQMVLQGLETPLEGAICTKMTFHMPMPRSWSKKRKEAELGKPMTSKPDIDNLMKWNLDILNGIAFVDDRLVTSSSCDKVWAYEGKVSIDVTALEMSLSEELKMMDGMAVEMHEALEQIFLVAHSLKHMFPHEDDVSFWTDVIIDKCLEAGLDEIIPPPTKIERTIP